MVKYSIHINGSSNLYRIDINCEWDQANNCNRQDITYKQREFESDIFFDKALKRHLFTLDETTLSRLKLSKHEHLSDWRLNQPFAWVLATANCSLAARVFGRDESKTELWTNIRDTARMVVNLLPSTRFVNNAFATQNTTTTTI